MSMILVSLKTNMLLAAISPGITAACPMYESLQIELRFPAYLRWGLFW